MLIYKRASAPLNRLLFQLSLVGSLCFLCFHNFVELFFVSASCFPFHSRANYKINFKRRSSDKNEEKSKCNSKHKHSKLKERPSSLPTSSATSAVQSPEFIPLMNIHPATPPECADDEEEPESSSLLPPGGSRGCTKASSMSDLSSGTGTNHRPEFFNQDTKLPPNSLMAAMRPDMDNLFLPIKPQISCSTSDTTLWKSKSRSSGLEHTDELGSKVKLSPGLQPTVSHPGKTEKVAQVSYSTLHYTIYYTIYFLMIHLFQKTLSRRTWIVERSLHDRNASAMDFDN